MNVHTKKFTGAVKACTMPREREKEKCVIRHLRFLPFVIAILALPLTASAGQARAGGAARFEVTSLRAVRPILVKTIADLEKKNAAAAKADMEDYDSAWNGVEVYVNTRSMDLYNEIEHHYQTAVTDALNKPNPDAAAILVDAKAMLAKYDEMLALVEKSAPLNRLYDDVARLRIERSHLREVSYGQSYHVVKQTKLAGEGGWDYVTVDPDAHRVYIPRGTHVMVVDEQTHMTIADIPGMRGIHGVAIVPKVNRGFVTGNDP